MLGLCFIIRGSQADQWIKEDIVCDLESSFIKTTYDISLDSQISLLPLGFSLTFGIQQPPRREGKVLWVLPSGCWHRINRVTPSTIIGNLLVSELTCQGILLP